MRQQRDGRIINITSVAGRIGFPGSGYYAASKHAVEGWSDSLRKEVEPLGIKVTCVEPGPFRTDWAGRSLKQTPTRIKDYEETGGRQAQGHGRRAQRQAGRRPGQRPASLMIEIAGMEEPPRHLVLGAWGIDAVGKEMEARRAEHEAWRARGAATDYDAA